MKKGLIFWFSGLSGVGKTTLANLVRTHLNTKSFKVSVIDGDEIRSRLHQHLGGVQDLDFSRDDQFLVTLGAQDDNAVVVWEVETGVAICGSPAFEDTGLSVRWLNQRNDRFVTAGNYHCRVWQVDVSLPKLHPMTAKMGNMRRVIQCISIDEKERAAMTAPARSGTTRLAERCAADYIMNHLYKGDCPCSSDKCFVWMILICRFCRKLIIGHSMTI